MPIDLAISIDLKGLVEELLIHCLVVIESMGVFGPCTHLEFDARLGKWYNGGFMIYFLMGLMNLFLGCIILLIIMKRGGEKRGKWG